MRTLCRRLRCSRFAVRSVGKGVDSISAMRRPQGGGYSGTERT
jgi:hypothetical protein